MSLEPAKTMKMPVSFREILEDDLEFVREVFNYYIVHTTKNARTEAMSPEDLKDVIHLGHPMYKSYLISVNETPCGFVYLSRFRKRQAYDRTAEITIYLSPDTAGKGIGRRSLKFMEDIALKVGIKVLVGIISGDNEESIALFKKLDYWQCAHYKQVGEKFGKTMDVVVYQKILES